MCMYSFLIRAHKAQVKAPGGTHGYRTHSGHEREHRTWASSGGISLSGPPIMDEWFCF